MTVTFFHPLRVLDAALVQRSEALAPSKVRQVNTDGYYFTRSENSLRIAYSWGGNFGATDAIEIIPVGTGRYALVRCGKHEATVSGKQLWSALSDFRRGARWAREDQWRARDYQDDPWIP